VLRLLLAIEYGKSQDIVYTVTTSRNKRTFPNSWWHSICLKDPWLSGWKSRHRL